MRNGSGVKITILVEGKEKEFRTGLAMNYQGNYPRLEFVLVDENDQMFPASVYSGGETGFGMNDYWRMPLKTNPEEYDWYKLITTDFKKIDQIFEAVEQEEVIRATEWEEKRYETVDRINAMPTEWLLAEKSNTKIFLKRIGNARFIKKNAFGGDSKIGHPYFEIVRKDIRTGTEKKICLDSYLQKNGVLMKKKIMEDAEYLFGLEFIATDVVELTRFVLLQKARIEKEMRNL